MSVIPEWFDSKIYEGARQYTVSQWAVLLLARVRILSMIKICEIEKDPEILEVTLESAQNKMRKIMDDPIHINMSELEIIPYSEIQEYVFDDYIGDFCKLLKRESTNVALAKAYLENANLSTEHFDKRELDDVPYWQSISSLVTDEYEPSRIILSINLDCPDKILEAQFTKYLERARESRKIKPAKALTTNNVNQQYSNRWFPLLDLYFWKILFKSSISKDQIYRIIYDDQTVSVNDRGIKKGKKQLPIALDFISNYASINALLVIAENNI